MSEKDEMLIELAKFFKRVGLLDRTEFRVHSEAPYSYRDIRKVFKNYAAMLYQVGQVVLPEEPEKATEVKSLKPGEPTKAPKPIKQEALDEEE